MVRKSVGLQGECPILASSLGHLCTEVSPWKSPSTAQLSTETSSGIRPAYGKAKPVRVTARTPDSPHESDPTLGGCGSQARATTAPAAAPAAGQRRGAPLSSARTPRAARRPDGTTTMRRERSSRSGPGGGRHTVTSKCVQESASGGGICLAIEETAGPPITSPIILRPAR